MGKRMKKAYIVFIVVIACFQAVVLAATTEHKVFSLLNEIGSPPPFAAAHAPAYVPDGFPQGRRSRPVTVLPAAASAKGLGLGDELRLNLFEDAGYTAVVERIRTNINGTVMIGGRLKEYPLSSMLMATTCGRSLITIDIPETGEHFRVQSEPGRCEHYLLQMDPGEMDVLEDAPSLVADAADETTQGQTPAEGAPAVNGPLDPVNIDVMIVYTAAAAGWADTSGGGIENVIAQAMQKAELAMANSQTLITVTLVYSGQIDYTESGSSSTDLSRLTSTTDGYMDEVHTLRNTYGADLVELFTRVEDTGGIGWLLNSTYGSPSYAFSISRVQQVGWTYTMIHEMGHNMGCHHHKEQTTQPGPGLFSYSAGWRWTGDNGGHYCSVMTYESGTYFADGITHTRVGYFSNPSVNYQNVPTGDAVDGDNARTLREIKDVVAAYRQSVAPQPPTALNGTAQTQRGQAITLTLNATDDGLPNPPAALSYIITSLPSGGILSDPAASVIETVPYTLVAGGNQVVFTPQPCYVGSDSFQFKVNDGGTAPTGGDSNTALVSMDVTGVVLQTLYEANMDTDPAWTFDAASDWAWGVPTGSGGERGNPDPTSAYTGVNVVGYNLSGDYAAGMNSTVWATMPAINCTGQSNVTLQFYRWLNVERSDYDYAVIQASTDKADWTTIWENSAEVTDSSWTLQSYDISTIADNQTAVYVRWGMGPTNSRKQYSGWNIDDVRVTSESAFTPLAGDFEPDCDIDLDDLIHLVAYWLQTCGDCDGADLLADGIVNLKDVQVLAENWLIEY